MPKTAGGAQRTAQPYEPAEPGGPAGPDGRGLPSPVPPHGPSACVTHTCAPLIGEAWVLPAGPGCARYARGVLSEALALAGASRSVIADAKLIVSELATNAHQHAPGHRPHELWLYAAPPPGQTGHHITGHDLTGHDITGHEIPRHEIAGHGIAGEARCAVFDRHRGARLPAYSWTSGDYGRGLSIVNELSEGCWGLLRTRSRCFPRVPGKAVWFAIPVPIRLPADPPGSG